MEMESEQSTTPLILTTLQKIAKIRNDTPERMRPSKRSVLIEMSILIVGNMAFVVHQFWMEKIEILYPIIITWIIIFIIAAYYEIDFYAYKLSMTSFRGFCISIAIITTIICDILRHFLEKHDPEALLTIILDDICYFIIIMLMMAADSAPKVTNFTRFLGPFNTIFGLTTLLITDNILRPEYDYRIFRFYYGSLTLNGMETASRIQLIWYGFTFIWAVPRDPKHEYFVFLDTKIKIKRLLPMREYIDNRKDILTKYIINGIAIIGVLYAFIYIVAVSWRDDQDVDIIFVIFDIILVLILLILIIILIYKYFQLFMIKELILQFRANMLMASILILIYVGIQKLFWRDSMNASFIIETLLNQIVFVIGCILAFVRDGMNISYPNYFVILFGILLGIVAFWNVFLLTFGIQTKQYPKWFILIEKQAYFQVIIISYLSIYYLIRDKKGIYFSLIRKRRKTSDLWGNIKETQHIQQNNDDHILLQQLINQ